MIIEGYVVHHHAEQRMRQRSITEEAVRHCLQYGSRHKNPTRLKQSVVEYDGVCVIIDRKHNKIVTVYSSETSARIQLCLKRLAGDELLLLPRLLYGRFDLRRIRDRDLGH